MVLGGNVGIHNIATPSMGHGAGVSALGMIGGGGGATIIGAVAKRMCKEGEVAIEDSLAKCLKLAVAAATTMMPAADDNVNTSGA